METVTSRASDNGRNEGNSAGTVDLVGGAAGSSSSAAGGDPSVNLSFDGTTHGDTNLVTSTRRTIVYKEPTRNERTTVTRKVEAIYTNRMDAWYIYPGPGYDDYLTWHDDDRETDASVRSPSYRCATFTRNCPAHT